MSKRKNRRSRPSHGEVDSRARDRAMNIPVRRKEKPLPQPVVVEPRHTPRQTHWQEVVDLQDAALRFCYTQAGIAYARSFGDTIVASTNSPEYRKVAQERGWPMPEEIRSDQVHWARNVHFLQQTSLALAEPIYTNGEIRDLIEAAASHETFRFEPLKAAEVYPTMYGFAAFPRPFLVKDKTDKTLSFRALCWTPINKDGRVTHEQRIDPRDATGVLVTAYVHRDDPDDYPITPPAGIARPELSLAYVTPWHFGADMPLDTGGSGLASVVQILQSLWRLAAQPITNPEREALPRHHRRRAERANLHADVTVIKLRHVHSSGMTTQVGGPIEHDHRWFVRGHWRNQWYPKAQEHKQIWINPYIKGPDDMPLRYRPLRAFELVR